MSSRTKRNGENAHQAAAFYVEANVQEASVATATQLQGKALSYNNIADTDAALECVKEFIEPACVIVKHANPCGVALGDDILQAYDLAYKTDPTSAFGGIIAFNRELDAATAAAIVERQFVEVILAPSVTDEAKEAVATKKNVRLLVTGAWPLVAPPRRDAPKRQEPIEVAAVLYAQGHYAQAASVLNDAIHRSSQRWPAELRAAMEEAIRSRRPTLVNAVIDEKAGTESGRITALNPAAKKKA